MDLYRYIEKNETGPPTSPYTTINSRWIKDLNISCDTIKALEENTGSKISGNPCSNIFANISSTARAIKGNVNKRDYIKLKSFFTAKESIIKMKTKLYERTYLSTIHQTRI